MKVCMYSRASSSVRGSMAVYRKGLVGGGKSLCKSRIGEFVKFDGSGVDCDKSRLYLLSNECLDCKNEGCIRQEQIVTVELPRETEVMFVNEP